MIECNSVNVWKRLIVLLLFAFLLAASSAQAVEKLEFSVGTSETDRLRDLLSGKRVAIYYKNGSWARGRVMEIEVGLLVVKVKNSKG